MPVHEFHEPDCGLQPIACGRAHPDPAPEDQPDRRRADTDLRRRDAGAGTAQHARIGARRGDGGQPRRIATAGPHGLALRGPGRAGAAGLSAGTGPGALERHLAVRRRWPTALQLAAFALQGRARCARMVQRAGVAAAGREVDRLSRWQDGRARQRLARRARRLGRHRRPAAHRGRAAAGGQRPGVLAGGAHGAAVCADRHGAEPAGGRPLRHRAAASGRTRSGRHRRGLQPHGERTAAPPGDRTPRRARRDAVVRQPRADALDRPAHRTGAAPDRP